MEYFAVTHRIDIAGTKPESLRLSQDILGFSPLLFPAPRERFNKPHGAAAFTIQTTLGTLALGYRPASLGEHLPQDAISTLIESNRITVLIADGITNLASLAGPVATRSQEFSHHLATHITPIGSRVEAASWLTSLPPLTPDKLPLGGSSLKLASITREATGYRLHLAQLGNSQEGVLLGGTVVVSPNGRHRLLPISGDTLPYMGRTPPIPNYQEHLLSPGSLLVMASDGLDIYSVPSFALGILTGTGPHYDLVKFATSLVRSRFVGASSLIHSLKTLSSGNPDDGSLALLWLK